MNPELLTGSPDFIVDPTRNTVLVFFVLVVNSNPNGDPDDGGKPRIFRHTGHGYITATKFRRMLRDYWDAMGLKTLVSPERPLNVTLGDYGTFSEAQADLLDARFFGNPSMDKRLGKAKAPINDVFLVSEHPVLTVPVAGTRCTPHLVEQEGGEADEKGTMHTSHVVSFGLYRGRSTYIALRGKASGISANDLRLFNEGVFEGWDHDTSTTRKEVSLHTAVQFAYPDHRFNPSVHHISNRVATALKPGVLDPTRIEDYEISINTDGLPPGMEVRVFRDGMPTAAVAAK